MRRQAVAFFLGDTAFLSDPKFRRLAKRLPDPDDFNSAVGAFFVALAAARRNGSPDIDVQAETESRFVDDLVAVGLLCETGFCASSFDEWAPRSQQSIAGRARAASAQRSAAGTFATATSSDASALASLGRLDQPSPPLPSIHIPTRERGAGERGPDDAAVAYFDVTGKPPSGNALSWLNQLVADHGEERLCAALRTTVSHPVRTYLSRVQLALTTVAAPARSSPTTEEEWMLEQAAKQRKDPLLDAIVSAYSQRKTVPPLDAGD